MATFPYKRDPRGEQFPIVDFLVYSKNRVSRTSALIDSGATISVFKVEVAKQLEINIEKGEEIYLGGVGGRIKGYIHKLELKIANNKFLCPVVFSYEYLVSLNLLGRAEFFKRYRIIFEENKNILKLE